MPVEKKFQMIKISIASAKLLSKSSGSPSHSENEGHFISKLMLSVYIVITSGSKNQYFANNSGKS